MTDSDGVYALIFSDGVGLVNVNVCVCVGFCRFWRKIVLS